MLCLVTEVVLTIFLCKGAKKAWLVSLYNIEVKMTRPPAYIRKFCQNPPQNWELGKKRISAWALLVCCNTQGLCSFITGIIQKERSDNFRFRFRFLPVVADECKCNPKYSNLIFLLSVIKQEILQGQPVAGITQFFDLASPLCTLGAYVNHACLKSVPNQQLRP